MAVEHPVEHPAGQGLHGRDRDGHVVDRGEVAVAAVEVGHLRPAVGQVGRVEQLAAAADVEHDRHAGLGGLGPDGLEADVARAVPGRAGRGHHQRVAAERDRLGGEVGARARGRRAGRSRRRAAAGRPSRSRRWRGCGRGPGRRRGRRHGARPARSSPADQVVKTSWLAKPRASRAAVRSSLRNDPSACQFLRVSSSSSALARNAVVVVLGLEPVPGLAVRTRGVRHRERREVVTHARIGERVQPVRRLDDVGVGVVDASPAGVRARGDLGLGHAACSRDIRLPGPAGGGSVPVTYEPERGEDR